MRVKTIKEILEAYLKNKTLESVKDYLLLKEELEIYDMDFLNALGVASRFKKLRALIDRLVSVSLEKIPLKEDL